MNTDIQSPNQEQKNLSILLVEDSGLQAKACVKTLAALGYLKVVACPDAVAALEKLNTTNFDLILCDWQMPKTSGLELLKELRTIPKYKSIPFIFLTAQAEKTSVIEALKSGAQDYIVKPPTSEILASKLSVLEAKLYKPV